MTFFWDKVIITFLFQKWIISNYDNTFILLNDRLKYRFTETEEKIKSINDK